jgi:Holliday junction resolvase RusA-like endonuclease
MDAITFCVLGNPVPQPRPRVSTAGGFARAYVPSTHPVHAYRKAIADAADRAGLVPQIEPLRVSIEAVFERPKSHLLKRGLKPDAPVLPRPDVDNIAKAVLDALQPVMGDDSMVARLTIEKRYGQEARTVVEIS